MKDVNDNQTADLLPIKRPRGRPRTGKALSHAERQAKYRAAQAEKNVTVTFNRDDVPALKLLLATSAMPNPSRSRNATPSNAKSWGPHLWGSDLVFDGSTP